MTGRLLVLVALCSSRTRSFAPPLRGALSVTCFVVEKKNPFDVVQDDGDLVSLDPADVNDRSSVDRAGDHIDAMLDKALDEAVSSVSEALPDDISSVADPINIVKEESFRKEVEDIFEKATLDLKASLDDIRKEQDEFAKLSAEQSALRTQARMKEDSARLASAEANMEEMLQRVNRETKEVEMAVKDLRRVQAELSESDPLLKLTGGGILRQASLASAILFSFRALFETIGMVGPDGPSHTTAALVQGAIALASGAYFFFA